MRMFIQGLSGEEGSTPTPPPTTDGGEGIFLMPDASGGDVGHGFTCTGLFFKEFNGLNPRFWVGNDGRNQEGSSDPDFYPSVVLVEIDYTSDNGNVLPVTTYATKLLEIKTKTIQDFTVQGVVEANDGTLWFASRPNVINIQPYADGSGNAIEISRFTATDANGLAYDEINNELLIKPYNGTSVERYSMSGTLLDSNVLSVGSGVDQINYDSANDLFYGGEGNNNVAAILRNYTLSTGVQGAFLGAFPYVLANEGVQIILHPDGHEYLYFASDAYYHDTGVPTNLQINAIHKIRIN